MNKINNNDIKLEIENHQYQLVNQPEFNFTSVTTFVGSFFEPFDEVKVANHLAVSYTHLTLPTICSV